LGAWCAGAMLLQTVTDWLPTLSRGLVTVQGIGVATVYLLLNRYNAKNRKRITEARNALSKKDGSLFELPAYRTDGAQCQNPFENSTWYLTGYERLKLSVLAVTIFPIRVFGVVSTVLTACLVAALFLRLGCQRAARAAIRLGCRVMLFWFGFIWIKVRGKMQTGVGVLISNHCSLLDGFIWAAFCGPRILAEESNFRHPVMQVAAKALGIVTFDRSGQESRRKARELMAAAAREAVQGEAPPILVFPAGTTTNLRCLITFKDGAFAPGLPVQPAILQYRFRHCDPTWVFAGPGTPMLLFKMLCQVTNCVDIEYLPMFKPSEEEQSDPGLFARNVRVEVGRAMGVPLTEHAVEDFHFAYAATKSQMPAEVGVVGFSALKEAFSANTQQVKQQLTVFKEMDRDGTGRVNFEEFKDAFGRAFHVPSAAQTEFLRQFFLQLTGGQPTLDFRRFLIGLALVGGNEAPNSDAPGTSASPGSPTSPSQRRDSAAPLDFDALADRYKAQMYVQLAFAAFATNADDRIFWQEFEELWTWIHPADVQDGGGVSGDVKTKSVSASAREAFESIGGAGVQEVTFDQFSRYADMDPGWVQRLRQAFFMRVSTQLST